MIETLASVPISGHVPSGLGNEAHPMRVMTRLVAGLDPGEWDVEARQEVSALFDDLADEWHSRTSPERTAVVADALERGLIRRGLDTAVEVGSGIGTYSALLGGHFHTVVSVDLSLRMLLHADPATLRVQADGGLLPLRDRSVDGVVLINAFAFPDEIDRVLRPGGSLIWVNSSGEETPIHLSTSDLVDSLPFEVHGVESRAGAGTWAVLTRVS